VTPIPGISTVINTPDWLTSEGRDIETDEELFDRYQLAWKATNGRTKYAYMLWATSVDGVESVKILDQHPRGQGTVNVIVKGTGGLPTDDLLSAVRAVIDAESFVIDDVEVRAPEVLSADIDIELHVISGDSVAMIADVTTNVETYFKNNIEIGESFTLDRLTALALQVSNDISSIDIKSPAADIKASDDALIVLKTLNVSAKYV